MNRISIIAVLLVLALMGVGAWFLTGNTTTTVPVEVISTTTSPIDTTDKEPSDTNISYQNPFGYEVTYPRAWVGEDVTAVYADKDALSAYMITPKKIDDAYVQTQILTIAVQNKALETLKSEIIAKKNIRARNLSELASTTLNGVEGLERPFDGTESFYYFEKNGKLYSLHFHYDEATGITLDEARKVLATFKITD
jgi:hypothetical protein